MPQDIDIIPMEKSLIDLASLPKNSFNSSFLGFDLSELLDDVILAEFADESATGEIQRGSIIVHANAQTNAWRVGKAILCGPNVRSIKPGDYIMFPNNMGIPIANVDIANYGKLKSGIFINQPRIFGKVIARKDITSASKPSKSKKSSTK